VKSGNWEAVASGAVDARDKIRKADAILTKIFVAEVTVNASYTWANMDQLKELQTLIRSATVDLIHGLKGRSGTTAPRKKSRAMVR
jgi:hypothetical protein